MPHAPREFCNLVHRLLRAYTYDETLPEDVFRWAGQDRSEAAEIRLATLIRDRLRGAVIRGDFLGVAADLLAAYREHALRRSPGAQEYL